MNWSILVSVVESLCLSYTEGERNSVRKETITSLRTLDLLKLWTSLYVCDSFNVRYGIKSLKRNLNTICQIPYQPVVLAFVKAATFCLERAFFFITTCIDFLIFVPQSRWLAWIKEIRWDHLKIVKLSREYRILTYIKKLPLINKIEQTCYDVTLLCNHVGQSSWILRIQSRRRLVQV